MPYIIGTMYVGTNVLTVVHGPIINYGQPPYYRSVGLQNMGTGSYTALIETGIGNYWGTADGTFCVGVGSAVMSVSSQPASSYPFMRVRFITSGTLSGTVGYAIQF
jgi:hypothetical protein